MSPYFLPGEVPDYKIIGFCKQSFYRYDAELQHFTVPIFLLHKSISRVHSCVINKHRLKYDGQFRFKLKYFLFPGAYDYFF